MDMSKTMAIHCLHQEVHVVEAGVQEASETNLDRHAEYANIF